MYLQKAFDRVWHHGLLHKLASIGLSCHRFTWLRSYLLNNRIVVRVGEALSELHCLSAGVPQGSHLGPILFTVFINDLPQAVCVPTELYADGALLHLHGVKLNSAVVTTIQGVIDNAAEWAASWHGSFSHSKTKIVAVPQTAK